MIQQRKHIQGDDDMQNPFLIQHEQRKDQDTGHSGYVKQAALMRAKEKEFGQHQPGAQVLIERV